MTKPSPSPRLAPSIRLLTVLGAFAVLGVLPPTARAQCLPASPLVGGDTVTCSGTIGATYPFPVDGAGNPVDDITVIIQPGTTISTIGDGIQLNDSSDVENSGTFHVDGPDSAAIRSGNGSATAPSVISNLLGGAIVVAADRAFGIHTGNLVEVQNDGAITLDGDRGVGIRIGAGGAGPSGVTNGATGVITINGRAGFGILVGSSTGATNDGLITVAGDDSVGIEGGANSILVNGATGVIALSGVNDWAMSVGDAGSAENLGAITIDGSGSQGLVATNLGTVTNGASGTITLNGSAGIGVSAANSAEGFNHGRIDVIGADSIGMSGLSSGRLHNMETGTIAVSGDDTVAMSAGVGGGIENLGTITIDGADSRGLVTGSFASATNGATGVITLNGTAGIGILAGDSADGQNLGQIEVIGIDSVGMSGGANRSLQNGQTGTISLAGDGTTAMEAGIDGTVDNFGLITIDGVGARGLVATDGGTPTGARLLNRATGTIAVAGADSYGLFLELGQVAANLGNVTVTGDRAVAIHADQNGLASNIGTIQVDAIDGIGLEAQPFDPTRTGQTGPDFYNVWNAFDASTGSTGMLVSGNPQAGPLIRLLPPTGGTGPFQHRVRNDENASLLADLGLLGTAGRALAIQGSNGNDEVQNAGTIRGLIDLGDGDDVYSHSATGVLVDIGPGSVDGGPGMDDVILSAEFPQLGVFRSDAVQNFERLRVQGYWTVQGPTPAGLDLEVDPGGVLRLDAPLLVNGAVTLTPPAGGETPATVQAVLSQSTSGLPQILRSTGDTTVDSGVLDVVVNAFTGSQTFTILRSDTDLVGQFARVDLPSDPAISFGPLVYDDVAHTLSLSVTAAAYSPNQTAVSNYLAAIEATGAPPDLQAILGGLDTLTYSAYGAAMDQLHPEAYDAHTTTTLELANRFTELMLERPRFCIGPRQERKIDPRTQLPCREHRLEPWLAIYGQLGNRTGDPGHISYDDQGAGLVGGLDYRIDDRWLFTGTIGTSYDSLDVDAVGVGRLTTVDLGLYAGYTRGPLRVQGVVGYGYGWQSRFRNISIPGFARTSKGEWGTNRIGTRLEGEYAFDWRGWTLAPMASVDYTALLQEAVYETGALPVSLQVDARTDNVVTLRAGFEIATAYHKRDYWTEALETVDGVWRPNLSVAWRQVVAGADRALTADFIGDPGTAAGQFTVYGQSPSEGFEVGAGVDWTPRNANRLTFGLHYDAFVWTGVFSQDLTAQVRYSF